MGTCSTITKDRFPEQGSYLGKEVVVYFHYDTSNGFRGVCIRDDAEHPFVTMFSLSNGTTVLATECQYSLL